MSPLEQAPAFRRGEHVTSLATVQRRNDPSSISTCSSLCTSVGLERRSPVSYRGGSPGMPCVSRR